MSSSNIEIEADTEDMTVTPSRPWYTKWQSYVRILIALAVIAVIVLAVIYNELVIIPFLDWMKNNVVLGSFVFVLLYWFCTVFFIPGSLLTLFAGALYSEVIGNPWGGIPLATFVVLMGAGLGATTAFVLGRYVLRERVASYKAKYQKFDIIDKVVEQQGLKVTFLLRLSPLIPFNVFNYAMGLTGVSFRSYNLAHIGMFPGTFAYCFLGSTIGTAALSANSADSGPGLFSDPLLLSLTIVGTVLALVAMLYISYVAKREFNKIASVYEEDDAAEDDEEAADGQARTVDKLNSHSMTVQ